MQEKSIVLLVNVNGRQPCAGIRRSGALGGAEQAIDIRWKRFTSDQGS